MALPAQSDDAASWREICDLLRGTVGDSTFEIWLSGLELRSLQAGELSIQAPADTQNWVAKRFGRILERAASSVTGTPIRVSFSGTNALPGTVPPSAREAVGATLPFNPRYSFDQFIIGEGNRLGHGAALAVAELPGQAYNPLFLYAPPGLGKTHLLHAIGNYVLAFAGGAVVRYTTAESFTNHFLSALQSRSAESFKRAYRDADVLLIDDVQFLASKARTEEEFFHTFNALYETGRQLVLTCDRLPQRLLDVEERLRERFESGLVAELRAPDFATRLAILRKRVALDRIPLSDPAVLDLIAERVVDNVRALEGALIRTVAHGSLTGRPIDAHLTRQVLDQIHPQAASRRVTPELIQREVSSYFQIPVAQLVSTSRTARVSWARQLAIHLARELTGASLPSIGAAFGGRNHTTVIHACRRVSERVHNDSEAAGDLDQLMQALGAGHSDRGC